MDDTDEDVSNLQFPPDIPKDTWILFNAEVAALLRNHKVNFQKKGRPSAPVIDETLEYVKRFNHLKGVDDAQAEQLVNSLRGTLETQGDYSQPGDKPYQRKLHPFEMAALANMFVSSSGDDPVDEARALIPSLKRTEELGDRFTDEEIESIINTVREFQSSAAGGGEPIDDGDYMG